MKKYVSASFWDYAGERALKTAIQALFVSGLVGGNLFDLDWTEIGSLAGGHGSCLHLDQCPFLQRRWY